MIVFFFFSLPLLLSQCIGAFHHNHCNQKTRPQFQFEDCYIPALDDSLTISQASFLMSHDSATGYVKKGSLSSSGLTWRYSKNQVGSAYQQLDDGARALDLRPKLLSNGTVIFQHSAIDIPVRFETLIGDAVQWCQDNPEELVLVLSSDFAYQTTRGYDYLDDDYGYGKPRIVSAMASIYQQFGIPYYQCQDVYQLTIAEIMEIARLPSGGYLLALDGQDYYGTPCAKPNWVKEQVVGCYSTYENTTLSCARRNPDKLQALKSYMLQSSNNPATDSKYTLGPPASTYIWPLFEIQAFWQVTAASAVTGVSRLSSIFEDNKKSGLNSDLIDMIHQEQFNSISILGVDNVALHGNALLSVLRTACGQSAELEVCGPNLAKPRLQYLHYTRLAYAALVIFYVLVLLLVGSVVYVVYVEIRDREFHPRMLWTAFHRLVSKEDATTEFGVDPLPPNNREELLKNDTASQT